MKKFMSLFLIAVVSVGLTFNAVAASTDTSGKIGTCTWTLNGTELTVSGNGRMEEYDPYDMPPIPLDDDSPWSGVKSIVIEKGVTSIKSFAFSECYQLETVAIPDTVVSIEKSAFSGCYKLNNIVLPASIKSIGLNAFAGCTGLTDVGYMGTKAQWESIILDGGNKYLSAALKHFICELRGSHNYDDCCDAVCNDCGYEREPIHEYVEINRTQNENGLCDIVYGCVLCGDFKYETEKPQALVGLKSVSAAATADTSGKIGTCTWTLNGTELIISGNGRMEEYDPYDMPSVPLDNDSPWKDVKSIVIEEGVTSIKSFAFSECYQLETVVIPDTVVRIEKSAFSGCYKLNNFVLPASIKSIGLNAFSGCTGLTDVGYMGTKAQWESIILDDGNKYLSAAQKHFICELRGSHNYDDCCDAVCNDCGYEREPVHEYVEIMRTQKENGLVYVVYGCILCGNCKFVTETTEAHIHSYDDDEDAFCNTCGEERELPHKVVVLGDVNGDGKVSAEDVTKLARHVAKIEYITDEYGLLAANVDKANNSVTAEDVTKLARFVAKIIISLE